MVANERIKVGGMTNAFAIALVTSGLRAASVEVLDDVTVPVWMPLAEADLFVDNAAAQAACERMGTCELQVYADARHCLFEEDDRFYEPFMADLVAFLDRHSGAAVP